MGFDGNGTFSRPVSDYIFDTVISETDVNQEMDGIATGLSNCITKDGQTTVSANIPFNNKKLTGLATGTVATDATNLGQVQANAYTWAGTAGGTADALTLTPSPAITAYAAGQRFWFVAASANTGAATVAVSGLTTKAIQRNGSALAADDIVSGKVYEIVYDGTQFQLCPVQTAATLAGTEALTNKTLTAPVLNGSITGTGVLDEDDMSSDSATSLATQQSIKAYVDANTGWTYSSVFSLNGTTGNVFTGLPAGLNEIQIVFYDVSLDDADNLAVQLGTSSGLTTSGYESTAAKIPNAGNPVVINDSSVMLMAVSDAAADISGCMILRRSPGTNVWVSDHNTKILGTATGNGSAQVGLAAELDRVNFQDSGGDNFDGGQVWLAYR